jgi:hypothetical protein
MRRGAQQLVGALCAALAAPAWAAQYHVRVAVDQIAVGYQRGKSPDRDYLTLYATSTHDPSSRANSAPTDVGTFSTNTTVNLEPSVLTDELLVNDADTIQLFADMENKSHTDPSKAVSDGLKIAGAVVTVLGAGELLQAALASGKWQALLNKEGGVVTLCGAVLALAGEVIGDVGDWLGLSDPDCDGAVFAPKSPVLVDVGKFFANFHGPIPLNTPLARPRTSGRSPLASRPTRWPGPGPSAPSSRAPASP